MALTPLNLTPLNSALRGSDPVLEERIEGLGLDADSRDSEEVALAYNKVLYSLSPGAKEKSELKSFKL
jgi:hypothetical protein